MANPFALEPRTNGQVTLHTSFGEIVVELWGQETPKACRNFIQLALEGYYDGCIFHRVIPNFIAQTGDPSGTGRGGESIYDEPFEDEISQRIKFNRRGLLAMANDNKRNTNLSQFFITLDKTEALQRKHTIFGRIEGDTIYNAIKFNEIVEFCDPPAEERPLYPPIIKRITVDINPFNDITPRITASERKEQEKARQEAKKEAKEAKRGLVRKAIKNKGLLSFGGDGEEEEETSASSFKFRAAADLVENEESQQMSSSGKKNKRPFKEPSSHNGSEEPAPSSKKQRAGSEEKESDKVREKIAQKRRADEEKKRIGTAAASQDDSKNSKSNNNVKSEIAKVEDSLRRLTGQISDDEKQESKASSSNKSSKFDGASLLAAQRKQYARGGTKGISKSKRNEGSLDELLGGFRQKIRDSAVQDKPDEEGNDEDNEEADDNDEGWLTHKLKFRKDATLDRVSRDDYVVHDPLAKADTRTLDDINREKHQKSQGRDRQYPGDRDRGRDSRRHEERSRR